MSYQLGEIVTSSKGIRSAPLSDAKGNPVFVLCRKPLTCPFGASAFNDPTAIRKNICFRCDETMKELFGKLDVYMASYVEQNTNRLFRGNVMTYKPALQQKEDYEPLLRCKINMGGSRGCKFWTQLGARTSAPEDFRECMLTPRIHIRGLWIMAGECGLQLEATDCMCDAIQEDSPLI